MRKNSRIPCLDGLRAVAIILVISNHLVHSSDMWIFNNPLSFVFSNGVLGVFLFFVVSGFIITRMLIAEHEEYGEIRIGAFYWRRALRIVPVLYVYILSVVLLEPYTGIGVSAGSIVSAATFLQNVSPWADAWPFEHVWSLSVEEQFYLLWPLALSAALRRGRGTAILLAIVLIAVATASRMGLFVFAHGSFLERRVGVLSICRMDALMFGCLAALTMGMPLFERVYRWATRAVWLLPVVPVLVSGLLAGAFGNYYTLSVGQAVDGACIVFYMTWLLRNPGSRAHAILNGRIMVHIGLVSYSLYIWQTYFLHRLNDGWSGSFPVNLLVILLLAEASYWGIERPVRALRLRIENARGRTVLSTLTLAPSPRPVNSGRSRSPGSR